MMEFLLYLTPNSQEIISSIMLKNYNIMQNAPICRNKQIFGVVQSPNFIICLDNIKNNISPVKHYVNETVYHEAVHIAQKCKGNVLEISVSLDTYKLTDVKNSVKATGSYAPYEMEAYYLEDKPEEVLYQLKKYCF